MTYRRTAIALLTIAVCMAGAALAAPANESDPPKKRARPPQWPADVLNIFFTDVREHLVGPRPDYESAAALAKDAPSTPVENPDASAPGQVGWSRRIDAEAIETEVKRLAQEVAKAVTTPSQFKGGAYEDCRRQFSELALLFAVTADFDGDARWQDSAASLRDLFARAARNCKVGTDQTFREAAARKQDLADLVSGSRPSAPPPDADFQWSQAADRPPLMQRLEIAHQDRLTKWLANEREFQRNRDDVRHEAQLVAVIADVISREGYDYWDEDDYAKQARELRDAATDLSAAAERDDFEQAQRAITRATKSCTACHEFYRG